MTKQEKWVDLFEKVTGRKPSPNEFMAGKSCEFDLKQIRQIAGLDQVPATPTETIPPLNPPVSTPAPVEAHPNTDLIPQVAPNVGPVVIPAQVTPVKPSTSKGKKILLGLSALALLSLGGAYYYFDQQTGPEVAVQDFLTAQASNDFDKVAQLLSTKDNKWTKDEAKGFLTYLTEQEIDVKTELEKLAQTPGQTTYNDQNGNKLLGLTEKGKLFGIFSEYQVATYPIDVTATSNLPELSIQNQKLEAGKELSLGQVKFAPTAFKVTGKTDLGDLNTQIFLNLDAVENNKVHLDLATKTKELTFQLPEGIDNVSKVKVFVNGKEISDKLNAKIDLLDNQEIEAHASFHYEGGDYTTDKVKTNLSDEDYLTIALDLPSDATEKIKQAKEKKKADADKARQLEETKSKITTFMRDYRTSLYYSIQNRTNTFETYYDTSSHAYQDMVDYTVNGGADRANLSYNSDVKFEMTNFEDLGNNQYKITMHNVFVQYFRNGRSSRVDRSQFYYLRKEGDSFKIYNIEGGG